MKKKIIVISVLFLTLVLTSAYMSQNTGGFSDKESIVLLSQLNVNVSRIGARVLYKQGGVTKASELTQSDGIAYTTLDVGTYDIYVYYPDPPNDGSSGSLLGFYHYDDDLVNVPVTIFY